MEIVDYNDDLLVEDGTLPARSRPDGEPVRAGRHVRGHHAWGAGAMGAVGGLGGSAASLLLRPFLTGTGVVAVAAVVLVVLACLTLLLVTSLYGGIEPRENAFRVARLVLDREEPPAPEHARVPPQAAGACAERTRPARAQHPARRRSRRYTAPDGRTGSMACAVTRHPAGRQDRRPRR